MSEPGLPAMASRVWWSRPRRAAAPGRIFSMTMSASAAMAWHCACAAGVLEVQLHNPLAAVHQRVGLVGRAAGAGDLDHVRTLLGQEHGRDPPGPADAQAEHSNILHGRGRIRALARTLCRPIACAIACHRGLPQIHELLFCAPASMRFGARFGYR